MVISCSRLRSWYHKEGTLCSFVSSFFKLHLFLCCITVSREHSVIT